MAIPWGSMASGASDAFGKMVSNQQDIQKEQAKAALQGIIEGKITPTSDASQAIYSPGQSAISKLTGQQPQMYAAGPAQQLTQAQVGQTQAQTGLIGAETAKTGVETGLTSAETKKAEQDVQSSQQTMKMQALKAQIDANNLQLNTNKANTELKRQQLKDVTAFQQKQGEGRPFLMKWGAGTRMWGGTSQEIQDAQKQLAQEDQTNKQMEDAVNKKTMSLTNQFVMNSLGQQANQGGQAAQGKYAIGQIVPTPKGNARVTGLTDPNNPEIEMVQ